MILSDQDILKEIDNCNIVFDPPIKEEDITPTSVDVHLGPEISVYKSDHDAIIRIIDIAHPEIATVFDALLETKPIPAEGFKLEPRQFVLSQIQEKITLRSNISARIEGRSTLARFGLTIHSTAPIVHATYSGRLMLEICNLGSIPINLRAGLPIAQLIFERVESIPLRTLNSHWQGK